MDQILKIRVGEVVLYKDIQCTITQLIDIETVLITEFITGTPHIVNISGLNSLKKITVNHDLSELDDTQWQKAKERYEIIKPLLEIKKRTRDDVTKRASEFNLHPNTLYRWLKVYESNGLITSLVRQKRIDAGVTKIPAGIESIIKDTIDKEYLTTQRKSVKKVYLEIKRQCLAASITVPHENTIRLRINQLTQKYKLSKRINKKETLHKFAPIQGAFPDANYPYSVIQIDHTPLDIILVDDIYRRPIGRPWITLAIDVFSRMVAGFYVSFDPPSALSTGLCLAQTILTKDTWLIKHEIKESWPCWGLPKKLHLDNAKEFRGKMLERACQQYGITIEWRPVARPHFGGHIERLLGTLLGEIHSLVGTTFSNPTKRRGYDSEQKAALTLTEFETWLVTYITQVYHQRIHSSLGITPLAKYKEGILGSDDQLGIGLPPKITDELRLRLDFMPFVERTVQPYGVAIDEIHYWHDILRPWIGSNDINNPKLKRKFIFRRDPRDLSTIWFYDPELRTYYAIPYRNSSHPVISLWELREAKRLLETEGKTHVNELHIFAAYERMRQIEEKAIEKTKAARRAKQRRVINKITQIPKELHPLEQETTISIEPSFTEIREVLPFDDLDDLS